MIWLGFPGVPYGATVVGFHVNVFIRRWGGKHGRWVQGVVLVVSRCLRRAPLAVSMVACFACFVMLQCARGCVVLRHTLCRVTCW